MRQTLAFLRRASRALWSLSLFLYAPVRPEYSPVHGVLIEIGMLTMLTKARRGYWLLTAGALGVLLSALVINFRGDRSATPNAAHQPAPARAEASLPKAPAVVAQVHEQHPYIVQADSANAARIAVQDVGGAVTGDLSVIRAVAASLDDGELAVLGGRRHDEP